MINQLYLLAMSSLIATASMAQCQELRRIASPFSNKTVIVTATLAHQFIEPVQYERVDENGHTQYLVHFYTKGSSLAQKGATIGFKDGSKIQWTDARVKSFLEKGQYSSHCVINLPEDLLEAFREKEIAFIKLSMNEYSFTLAQAQRARNILNCVVFSEVLDIQSDKVVSQQ